MIAFRTPAIVLDGLAAGEYCVAAASLVGTAHMAAGSVRQDAYDFMSTSSGDLVVAIADGLGSRAHSQVGARLFCEGVLFASGAADESFAGTELLSAGAAYASRIAHDVYELADDDISFVAAVAVFRDGGCAVARVGDVSAFVVDPEGGFGELFATDSDFVNVVRSSLPGASAEATECATSRADTVALVTDGLAGDIRTSPAVRTWLSEQWRTPLGAHAMGESLRYRRQGSHDDRTAVIVWTEPDRAPLADVDASETAT